ncbi:MAG: FHA domain-containing protein [Deltaproteobacteria bacterium]|nr:FHA domain-containing protein [Deltaproteobacteria bacterium]
MLGLRVITPIHDPFPSDVPIVPGPHRILVGRRHGMTLRLRHPSVSSFHAELFHDGRRWWAIDQRTADGARVPFGVGDVLRFGEVEVAVVEIAERSPEPALVASSFGPDPAFAPLQQLATPQAPEVDGLEITPAFVFVYPNRLRKSFGAPPPPGLDRARILPRLGEEVELFGGRLLEPAWPDVEHAALATLKTTYGASGDPIVLAIVAPHAAGREVVVKLWHGRRPQPPRKVPIDERGVGRLEIAWLPPGDWVAALEGRAARAVAFRVGELTLAPLAVDVLSLERVTRDDGSEHVHARLGLLTFGSEVRGPVHVTVVQEGRRASMQDAEPTGGVITIDLEVPGGADATLALALVDDPSRVAYVPLVRLTASEPADPEAPLVARAGPGPVVVEVTRPCVAIAMTVLDPAIRFAHHETREGVAAGETITAAYAPRGPLVWVLLAAIVEGPYGLVAWQGRATVMSAPRAVAIDAPARVAAGVPWALSITAPGASARAAAWVMVRDRRLAPVDGLGERRAAQAVAGAEALRDAWPEHDFATPPAPPRRRTTVLEIDPPPPVDPVRPLASSPVVIGSRREPELVLFADVVPLVDGRATVSLNARDAEREHTIEVVVVDGARLDAARAALVVEPVDAVALDLPGAVHPEDAAWGHVHVRATRPATLRVMEGERVALEVPVAPGRTTHVLEIVQGSWRASVVDASGVELSVDGVEIAALGSARAVVRAPLVIPPFGSMSIEDDASVVAFELPATPRAAFADFVRATATAPGDGVEALAARLLAWAALTDLIDDPAERAAIDRKLVALVARLGRLRDGERLVGWVGGPHEVDVAASAALHLVSLLGLPSVRAGRLGWLAEAVRELVPRAALAPTIAARTPSEAWRVVCLGASAESHASSARAIAPMVTSVAARADAAYAAAVLALTGEPEDRVKALATARAIVRRVGPGGRLASTWDSGALVALASALGDVGLDEDLQLEGEALAAGDRAAGRRARWVSTGASGALVIAERVVSEELDGGNGAVPIDAQLVGPRGYGKVIHVGDVVRLEAEIATGLGDLVLIELPPALVALRDGARVRRLELDPLGQRSLALTLLAVSPTQRADEAPRVQHGLVTVRNAYDEARGGRAELGAVVLA